MIWCLKVSFGNIQIQDTYEKEGGEMYIPRKGRICHITTLPILIKCVVWMSLVSENIRAIWCERVCMWRCVDLEIGVQASDGGNPCIVKICIIPDI